MTIQMSEDRSDNGDLIDEDDPEEKSTGLEKVIRGETRFERRLLHLTKLLQEHEED